MAYLEMDDQAEYLALASALAAKRFVEATEQTFDALAQMPGIGVPCEFSNPRLHCVRCSPVRGFKKYLIFYRAIEGGIEVLHVLHGARDISILLGEESE